jgi:S1-C subfamily serine protease
VLRPLLALVAALSAAFPSAVRSDALSALEEEQRALFERVAPGVVVISNGPTLSAGFAAAPGLVVASAHGVQDARDVEVAFRDGRIVRGEVVASSPHGLDLALVRVPETPGLVLALAPVAALRAGDVVAAVGHGEGNRWSFTMGMVSNPAADGADGALVRLQLALRPGASGGPVVDRAGRVVGVVALGDPGAVAFAIRSDVVLRAFPEIAAGAVAGAEPAAEREALAAAEEEAALAAPLSAPELLVGLADPRPAPARVALAVAGRRPRAPLAGSVGPPSVEARAGLRPESSRARAREPIGAEAAGAYRAPSPRDAGGLLRELAPLALVAAGGVALAALLVAGLLAASALGSPRPAGPPRLHRRAGAPVRIRDARASARRVARAARSRDPRPRAAPFDSGPAAS